MSRPFLGIFSALAASIGGHQGGDRCCDAAAAAAVVVGVGCSCIRTRSLGWSLFSVPCLHPLLLGFGPLPLPIVEPSWVENKGLKQLLDLLVADVPQGGVVITVNRS